MLNVLLKTLGFTFYRQHSGLFLVIFYLLFGMIQGYDLIRFHHALLLAICAKPLYLLLLFSIWLLYVLKCMFFVKQKIGLPEHNFIKIVCVASLKKQAYLWTGLYGVMLLPLILYSLLMIGTAAVHHFYFCLLLTPCIIFLFMGIMVWYSLSHTNFAFYTNKPGYRAHLIMPKPFWSWPLFYLIREQPLMLVMVKIVSILSFQAILWLFADVGNDVRVNLMAWLAVIMSHATLVVSLVKFDAIYGRFAWQLPVSFFKRLCYQWVVFLVILFPETLLLGLAGNFDPYSILNGMLLGLSGLITLQLFVFIVKADMERYMIFLLCFFFISMMAVLAHYYLIYSAGLLLCSSVLLLRYFRKTDLKTLA